MADAKESKPTKTKDTRPKTTKKAETAAKAAPAKTKLKTEPVVKKAETAASKAKPVAKAGKRSAKAVKEAEEKQAKADRKDAKETTKAKPSVKPPRSREERAGKKYRQAAKLVEKGKTYDAPEAMALLIKTATTKFDSTVELHVNLGVDPKQADQNVRATVGLPSGSGKTLRVAVFCDVEDTEKAKKAGADIAGVDAILPQLDREKIDFDVIVATPKTMPQLGKYARLLGPKGLMPNPKSGTVTADVATATREAKSGKVEYRVDPAGIVHLGIGKVSFGAQKLMSNYEAIMDSLKRNKPASLKGIYIQKVSLTTTMGPSIRVKA